MKIKQIRKLGWRKWAMEKVHFSPKTQEATLTIARLFKN
jgi:hypothetical protein